MKLFGEYDGHNVRIEIKETPDIDINSASGVPYKALLIQAFITSEGMLYIDQDLVLTLEQKKNEIENMLTELGVTGIRW